jgi:hypothetical protein
MPTIAEGINSNIAYRANNPGVSNVKPIQEGTGAGQLITFQPPVNLPVRGIFPPDLVVGTDFYSGIRQFRNSIRSSSMIPPVAQENRSRTPRVINNKKLVAPTIGGGSAIGRYNSITGTLTPVAVAGNTTATQNFKVSGIQASDKLIGHQWITPQTVSVVAIALRVISDNTIAIDFLNPTGGSLTPTGGSIVLILVR